MSSVSREQKVIAQNFKALRHAHCKTQQQIGKLLGVTPQQIQKYETAQNRISADALWTVAQFYKIEVSYFFEGLKQDKRKKSSELMRVTHILESMPRATRETTISFILSLAEPPSEEISE